MISHMLLHTSAESCALSMCKYISSIRRVCSSFAVLQSLSVGVGNKELTALESIAAQIRVDFQDVLPGSVHAGDHDEFFVGRSTIYPFCNLAPS
jgi:hypothetical protein